jgi:hypothetical protein
LDFLIDRLGQFIWFSIESLAEGLLVGFIDIEGFIVLAQTGVKDHQTPIGLFG